MYIVRTNRTAPTKDTPKLDVSLQRTSHISQILLVALAIYSYFTQVVPILQKEKLEEEVIAYQKELSQREDRLAQINKNLEEAEASVLKKETELSTLQADLITALAELNSAINEKAEIERKIQFMDFIHYLPD